MKFIIKWLLRVIFLKRMNMKFNLILPILFLSVLCYAQEDPMKGYFQTPNVTSLGIFGQIPVSLFTGIPQINIPLYSVSVDNVDVNIALDYHTSLVKPNSHPSWAGLGWNLTVGGVITRTPNGQRDEDIGENADYKQYIYNANYGQLNNSNWEKLSNYPRFTYSLPDYEPDEFSFNFGNYSGSFFKNSLGQWQVRSANSASMRIKHDTITQYPIMNSNPLMYYLKDYYYQPAPTSYYRFEITTEDGTKYIFGGNANSCEGNYDNTNKSQSRYMPTTIKGHIDTWMLTKIITSNNREINFNYTRGTPTMTVMKNKYTNSAWVKITTCTNKTLKLIAKILSFGLSSECGFSIEQLTSGGVKRTEYFVQTPVFLNSIISDDFKIYFHSSNSTQIDIDYSKVYETDVCLTNIQSEWKQLDSISINTNNDVLVKRIKFEYTNNNTERLKLLSVTDKGNSQGNNFAKHSFHYNTTKMPNYPCTQTDHWGYYNGADYYNSSNIGQVRSSVNFNYLIAEVLDEITYPTKGKAVLEYEPHQYSKYISRPDFDLSNNDNNENILTGGLRIKKIKLLDKDQSILKETEYLYVKDYKSAGIGSSGILAGMPQYFDIYQGEGIKITSSSIYPGALSYTNGSHITYSEVTEKISKNGFITHRYTNFDISPLYCDKKVNCTYESLSMKDYPFSSMSYIRGKEFETCVYSESKKLTQRTFNEYSQEVENDFVRAVKFYPLYSGFPVSSTLMMSYKNYTGKHNLVKQTVTTYNSTNSDSVRTEQTYNYNKHNLLSNTSLQRNDNDWQCTKFVYPFDLEYTNSPDITIMNKMTEKHILSPIIEKVTYLKNNGKVIEGIYNKYEEIKTNSGVYKPARIDILPSSGYNYTSLYPINSGNINLFLEQGMHINEIRGFSKTFTINKYPAKVNINMALYQENKYLFNDVPNLCFVITIIDNTRNKTVYLVEAMDRQYGTIDNKTTGLPFEYKRMDEIILPAGNYTIELTHKSRWKTEYGNNPTVGHTGICNLTYIEYSPSMCASYPLLIPEMYYKYRNNNIVEAKQAGSELTTVYIWGYRGQYPIAEIRGATYSEVTGIISESTMNSIATKNEPSISDFTAINNLRTSLPKAFVTTYTYKPLIGIWKTQDPRKVITEYVYDSIGRLQKIYVDGKAEKEYEYHYKN
jgi:hypothetical protein